LFSVTAERTRFPLSAFESSQQELQNICWGQGREGYGICATGTWRHQTWSLTL